jgi:hypothetical protein
MCVQHAFLEGKKAEETSSRKGTPRTLKWVGQQYPGVFCWCCGSILTLDSLLGRVDELFDANPRGHQMNECEKGLAQFLIPRGNASKLFEVVKEPFHLLP